MDITTEISLSDLDIQFDDFDVFGDLEDDIAPSTEMIEREMGKGNFDQDFAADFDA